MKGRKLFIGAGIFLWLLMIGFFSQGLQESFDWPYPSLNQTLYSRYGLIDSLLILTGFRNLASDVAWIQLLQYVGGPLLPEESPSRPYDFLEPLSLRVVRIDPFNRYARLYGAGFLGFSRIVRKPEEAIKLLREGIEYDPSFWRYHLYIGAIAYQKKGNTEKVIPLLEEALKYPDCPALVKSVLANIYKKYGQYHKAIRIWENILESEATDYWERAYEEIRELKGLKRRRR